MNLRYLYLSFALAAGMLVVASVSALLGEWSDVPFVVQAQGADAYSVYYVAPAGSNCGGMIPCYTDIQDAVDTIDDSTDVIKVATGVYSSVNGYGGLAQVVYITKSLTIRGGYTTSDWDTSDPATYITTLDANGGGRVVYISGDVTVTLGALHLTGGDASGLGGDAWGNAGGGVYALNATVTLSGCNIADNEAPFGSFEDGLGGGMYADGSTVTLLNSQVLDNRALGGGGFFGGSGWGGGLCFIESRVTLEGNIVRENQATGDWGVGGGMGLYACPDFLMVNNVIADNQADYSGGGVEFDHMSGIPSTGNMLHTTIARNQNAGVEGVRVAGGSVVTLANTILVAHDTGINVSFGSTATLTATLWGSGGWSNDTDWGDVGDIFTGTINIWGNPVFVDPDTGDYHIVSSSAAQDQGVDVGVAVGLDGGPRDASPDLGAYEAVSGALLQAVKATSADLLNPGEVVTYTVVVTNAGSISVTNVVVTDTLPGLQQPMGTTTDRGTCIAVAPGYGGKVACDIGDLETGQAAHITITAQVHSIPAPVLPHVMRNAVQAVSDQAQSTAYVDVVLQDCYARVGGALPEYTAVQTAVDAAESGDVVWIAGTCVGAHERDGLAQQVHVTKSLTLRGGYSTDFSVWNPGAYITTLDATGQGRVIYVAGPVDVTVEALTLSGGNATGLGGAAITADDAGGGVFAITATLTLSRAHVINNIASISNYGFGGGVGVANATLTLLDTTVTGNTASGNSLSVGYGGGLSGEFSTIRLERSRLENNNAGEMMGLGGGATVLDGDLTANATLWLSNTASSSGWGQGGGLSIEGYTAFTLTNCVLADNKAAFGGSGLWIDGASGVLLHPTIARNQGSAGVEVNSIFVDGITLTNAIVVSHSVGLQASEDTTATVSGVLWYSNITNTVSTSATVQVSNAFTGSPAFAADGYHLTADSSAIYKGVSTSVTVDIDGDARGKPPDLGADELAKRHIYLPLVMRND